MDRAYFYDDRLRTKYGTKCIPCKRKARGAYVLRYELQGPYSCPDAAVGWYKGPASMARSGAVRLIRYVKERDTYRNSDSYLSGPYLIP